MGLKVAIIGPGKVGTSLGALALRAGCSVIVAGRNKARARAAAALIGDGAETAGMVEAACAGDLILLTVSDDAIEPVCNELAEKDGFKRGATVAHCSGCLSSEVLSQAKSRAGCGTASLHPLQTFPNIEAGFERLPGSYCFYEGDENALPTVEEFLTTVGLKGVKIESSAKSLYHAAAVTACNYFVALMDAALEIGEKAGIDRSVESAALEPLVVATLRNVFALGPVDALTGPIMRGDVDTVRRHLSDLRSHGEDLLSIYKTMGRRTLDLAIRRGSIPQEWAGKIARLLSETER